LWLHERAIRCVTKHAAHLTDPNLVLDTQLNLSLAPCEKKVPKACFSELHASHHRWGHTIIQSQSHFAISLDIARPGWRSATTSRQG
jgi:hypothetical protein